MAQIRGNLLTGLAIGIGLFVVAPALLPALARIARPTAKAALKAGLMAYDRGREALAELGETAGDVMAEARAEIEQGGDGEVNGEDRANGGARRVESTH